MEPTHGSQNFFVQQFQFITKSGATIAIKVVTVIKQVGEKALEPITDVFNPSKPKQNLPPDRTVQPIIIPPPQSSAGAAHTRGGEAQQSKGQESAQHPSHQASHPKGGPSASPSKKGEAVEPSSETEDVEGEDVVEELQDPALIEGQQQPEEPEQGQLVKFINIMIPSFVQNLFAKEPQMKQTPESKAPEESQPQKSREARAETASKGESKTTQGKEAPIEVDPTSRLSHFIHGRQLERKDHGKEKIEQRQEGKAEKQESRGAAKKEAQPLQHTHTVTPGTSVQSKFLAHFFGEQHPVAQAQKTASQGEAAQRPSFHAQVQPTPPSAPKASPQVPPSPGVHPAVPETPKEVKAQKAQELAIIANAAQAQKPVTPRRDAITGLDRPDAAVNQQQRSEDRVEYRFPFLDNLEQAREELFKEFKEGKGARVHDERGYRLNDLVLMMLCAIICGAKNPIEIAQFVASRESFFRAWMGITSRLPSYRLFHLLLTSLEPVVFQELIDYSRGKNGITPFRNVRVWESDCGIVLAELVEEAVETSVPIEDAMKFFDVEGSLVTLNMVRIPREVARWILRKGGEYNIILKGRHGVDFLNAQEFFGDTLKNNKSDIPYQSHLASYQDVNRSESMEVTVSQDFSWLMEAEAWTGLKAAVQVLAEVVIDNSSYTDQRFYLSSHLIDAEEASRLLRVLPTLERRTEWYADLNQVDNVKDHTLSNLDQLRHAGWTLLDLDTTRSATLESKSKKAAGDNEYLRALIAAA